MSVCLYLHLALLANCPIADLGRALVFPDCFGIGNDGERGEGTSVSTNCVIVDDSVGETDANVAMAGGDSVDGNSIHGGSVNSNSIHGSSVDGDSVTSSGARSAMPRGSNIFWRRL
ncbi:PREDICTED: uncharacterized protein LOC108366056 [Rhagoletis zephyria]|uniref:uncharacterized protein LOC108366056 n=1 Tax=Rhagoletis zephyria TaxID=28612 RepID=UPI000811221C|nr:PREDICTED: uncharacterized protein LOC108366056 [Rhagoletis zephyria]